ncbi:MAG: hypothetical protein IBJ19_19125 [Gemmatimonadaceae bacterium]|nr:hypothetical protein [Gemmatimonadaceae bacterium]
MPSARKSVNLLATLLTTACVAQVGSARVVRAQAAAEPVAMQAGSARVARDTVTRTAPRWHFDQCMGGLTYGAPFKFALAYGMGYVRESETTDWCFLGAAKVGLGGASFNVGLANSLGHWGSGTAVTAGILRTFDNPLGALAKRTYVGGSVHLWPLLALGGEVGYYVPLGRDAQGERGKGMVTWSAGFGF